MIHPDGRKAVILGNGPSLAGFDFERLRPFDVFGMNAAYRHWHRIGWYPQFYSCLDLVVGLSHAGEIRELIESAPSLGIQGFLLRQNLIEALGPLNNSELVTNFDLLRTRVRILRPPTVTTGSHTAAWAVFLGYQEVFLLGIDCNYVDIIEGARRLDGIELELVEVPSHNPNYFFPDYQRPGDRYNIPNPNRDVHIESWRQIALRFQGMPCRILNANLESRVDAFDFCRFEDLEDCDIKVIPRRDVLGAEVTSTFSISDEPGAAPAPRLLSIDLTKKGDGTATGELKARLLAGWPNNRLFQIFGIEENEIGADAPAHIHGDILSRHLRKVSLGEKLFNFQPEVVMYRPTPDNIALHETAMKIVRCLSLPLVVIILDDWPARLEANDQPKFERLNADLKELFDRSDLRFVISHEMAAAFRQRYGRRFEVYANGVEPAEWPIEKRGSKDGVFRVRYAGALAEDMCLDSVLDIARAIESVPEEVMVEFEVKTSKRWYELSAAKFQQFRRTRLFASRLSPAEYRRWLGNADVVVVAYNFDESSRRYVQYSMANKMPECLASGAVTLAYGPADFAAISFLQTVDGVVCVTRRDQGLLTDALLDLIADPDKRHSLSQQSRAAAFDRLDLRDVRTRFQSALVHLGRAAVDPLEVSPGSLANLGFDGAETQNVVQSIKQAVRERSPILFRFARALNWLRIKALARPLASSTLALTMLALVVFPTVYEPLTPFREIGLWISLSLLVFVTLIIGQAGIAEIVAGLLSEVEAKDEAITRNVRDIVEPLEKKIQMLETKLAELAANRSDKE